MNINKYISEPRHRLFKIKIKDKDKTIWRNLDYWGFIKYKPKGNETDYYYSTSLYRNLGIKGKAQEQDRKELYLGTDILCIDLDGTPPENNLRLVKFIEDKGYKRRYMLQTRKGHYQIAYSDLKPPFQYKLPKERLDWYKGYRKRLVKEIKDEGLVCDFSVLENPTGVIRIPESERIIK